MSIGLYAPGQIWNPSKLFENKQKKKNSVYIECAQKTDFWAGIQ